MTLREEYLRINHGDVREAAAYLALRLTRDDPETFKVGYSIPNAILAAREVFPEIEEDQIRFLNRWMGWMDQRPNCQYHRVGNVPSNLTIIDHDDDTIYLCDDCWSELLPDASPEVIASMEEL